MTLNKFGILVNRLDNSELGILAGNLANSFSRNPNVDIIVFREEIAISPLKCSFSFMQFNEVWSYNGVCISTDLISSEYLLAAPCPIKKYFYIWNLEWLYQSNVSFEKMSSIYQSSELELICRSESHYNIVSKLWKKPVGIIEDFNREQFKEIFGI